MWQIVPAGLAGFVLHRVRRPPRAPRDRLQQGPLSPGLDGPDLSTVAEHRTFGWIYRMILAPDSMMTHDPTARELLSGYLVRMPAVGASPWEALVLCECPLRAAGDAPPPGGDARPRRERGGGAGGALHEVLCRLETCRRIPSRVPARTARHRARYPRPHLGAPAHRYLFTVRAVPHQEIRNGPGRLHGAARTPQPRRA